MTNARDDDLKMDAGLSAGYRARSNEMPSAGVDAKILAASRRAVGSRPLSQPRHWFRWIDAPLATAAVVLVSASLLLLMREQGHFDRDVIRQAKEVSPVSSLPTAPIRPLEAPTPAPAQTDAAAKLEDARDRAVEIRRSETEATDLNGRAAAESEASGAAQEALPARSSVRLRDESGKERADLEGTIGEEAIDSNDASKAIQEAPAASMEATPPSETQSLPHAAPEAFPGASDTAAGVGADSAAGSSTMGGIDAIERDKKTEPAADESLRRTEKMQAPDAAAPVAAPPATGSVPVPAPAATTRAPDTGKTGSLSKDFARDSHALSAEEKELEAIRELIRAGKFSDARVELERFTKAHPDFRLPDDIIEALKPSG